MATAVRDFIGLLETDPGFRERVVHIETIPPRRARYGDLSRSLPEGIRTYCDGRGVRLYTHQCAAIEHLRAGENVIITTSTASGKALAFLLPLFKFLALMTHELVRDSACAAGCPVCIHSPECGNQNQPLDKGAAVIILDGLAGRLPIASAAP